MRARPGFARAFRGAYAYCIVPREHEPPRGLKGLDSRPVSLLDLGPFALWVTEGNPTAQRDLETIGAHHRVVETAMEQVTPLPLRFGAWAPDVETLRERVLERRDQIEQALELVDGCVEYGLRAAGAASPSDPAENGGVTAPLQHADGARHDTLAPMREAPAPGRSYLHALRRAHDAHAERARVVEDAAARIARQLGEIVREERVRTLEAPGLFAAAHLVRREDRDRYLARIRTFVRDGIDGHTVHVTGPWPPYSFTGS